MGVTLTLTLLGPDTTADTVGACTGWTRLKYVRSNWTNDDQSSTYCW